MAICSETKKWVEEQVERPMEQLVENTKRECRKRKWYDPRSWFCWLTVFFVKVIQIVLVTVGKWVTHVVCVVVTAVLNAAAFVVGLVLSIPIIGAIIRAIVRVIAEIASQIVNLFDLLGRLFGIRIRKNLRVCMIILKDDHSRVVNPSLLAPAIAWANNALYSQAKVRLIVTSIKEVNESSPEANLDVDADAGAVWNELWTPGSYFETAANGYCFDSAFEKLAAVGSPVIGFVVRSVAGQATGCSLSTITDYVTLERGLFDGDAADPTVFAHELGHACLLPHFDSQDNLMHPTSSAGSLRGFSLTPTQVHFLRGSRHVTFL